MSHAHIHPTHNTQQNWDYYNGNHWKTWIGPTLPADFPDRGKKMAELERVFQSANIIKECTNNWRAGLISEPFTWYLKDSQGKRTKAAEAELQLQRWLDWTNQQAIATGSKYSDPWAECLTSLGVTGKGNLRLWQPARFADDPDPVHRIHLHCPADASVEVKRGEDGFIDRITYAYGSGRREVQTMVGDRLVVVDGEQELEIATGSRWTIQQICGESLITESVKRLQDSINHGLTMKLRNQTIAGFRQTTFIDVEPPGRWVEDDSGNQSFEPSKIARGPGIDNFLSSAGKEDGQSSSPQIFESQPVTITTLSESIKLDIQLLYRQFYQSYRLQAAEGMLSGESRIQQRQDFELFLRDWQRRIEAAIANILNVVLRILGYENLEVVVSLNISTGKLTAEERNQLISENQAGLLSDATAISKLGTVDDVDAELALIAEETRAGTQPKARSASDAAEDTLPPAGETAGNQSTEALDNSNGNEPRTPRTAGSSIAA